MRRGGDEPLAVRRQAGPGTRDAAGRRPRPRARSAQGSVLKGIGLAILSGEFPSGSPLPAKEVLMERFGVSNTPLREALQALASKGLIAARTKVGTWVRDPADWNMFDPDILNWQLEVGVDLDFLGKLFEMRQSFEPVAAAIAAHRRTPAQIAEMRAIIRDMRAVWNDRALFADADLAFHLAVLAAAGNPFMQSIGALIRTALTACFARFAPTDDADRAIASVAQHESIAEAIAAGDAQAAADGMMTVIRQGWSNVEGGRMTPLANVAMHQFMIGRASADREPVARSEPVGSAG